MEAGVRYSAAGVVAEAHLATGSHSGKLLRDLPSPKRCGTRATITGSSSFQCGPWPRWRPRRGLGGLGRRPSRGLLARMRAQPPARQCDCTTRPCVKGSCTQQPLSASHDLRYQANAAREQIFEFG